ncbi:MAG: dihydropteroate synthase [Thermoanaerobaculia bacterium]|nr:dihydropteroate synthase [Thermoanaerobaculia bacterium]
MSGRTVLDSVLNPQSSVVPLVMGILNITPDSFSDGGVHFELSKAVHAAMQMEEDGAAIVDIGGESTRPGAEPVSLQQEIDRVVPVIAQIRRRSDLALSVDTRNAAVAREALDAGADIINDVSGLNHDPEMVRLAAWKGVPVIVMHMRGDPRTMQQYALYGDVVADVIGELRVSRGRGVEGGIDEKKIFVDPGIGFAKTFEHNLEILARCAELRALGPFVIGASRKAFIGELTGRDAGPQRMVGSLAAVAAAMRGGASIVRVHDVRETIDFMKVMRAIGERRR